MEQDLMAEKEEKQEEEEETVKLAVGYTQEVLAKKLGKSRPPSPQQGVLFRCIYSTTLPAKHNPQPRVVSGHGAVLLSVICSPLRFFAILFSQFFLI